MSDVIHFVKHAGETTACGKNKNDVKYAVATLHGWIMAAVKCPECNAKLKIQ